MASTRVKKLKAASSQKTNKNKTPSKISKPKSKKASLSREGAGWRPLQQGSVVDIIAPASKCSLHELQAGMNVLKSWGLKPRSSPQIFGPSLLHAHSDQERWEQLKEALCAEDSSVLWCARGGYGSMKLLPFLQKMKKPKRTKLFVGLSDVTSLSVFFNQVWNWPVLHAPILSRVGRGDLPFSTLEDIERILFGELEQISFELQPLNGAAKSLRHLQGEVIGGNWTTLMAGIGTPFEIKTKGRILFLEDVGERGYRLDRFWEQWKQAGVWEQISALVLGDFTEGDEPNGTNLMWEVLKARAETLKKPVFAGLPSGHGSIQRPLPLGAPMTLKKTSSEWVATVDTGVMR